MTTPSGGSDGTPEGAGIAAAAMSTPDARSDTRPRASARRAVDERAKSRETRRRRLASCRESPGGLNLGPGRRGRRHWPAARPPRPAVVRRVSASLSHARPERASTRTEGLDPRPSAVPSAPEGNLSSPEISIPPRASARPPVAMAEPGGGSMRVYNDELLESLTRDDDAPPQVRAAPESPDAAAVNARPASAPTRSNFHRTCPSRAPRPARAPPSNPSSPRPVHPIGTHTPATSRGVQRVLRRRSRVRVARRG